jgi:hypothetical protein
MTKLALLVVAIILAVGAVVLQSAAADPDASEPAQNEPAAGLDHTLSPCADAFTDYDLGPAFQGLALVHTERFCSDPEPVKSQSAGGGVDPDSLGRSHFAAHIYGSCVAASDMGCAPPLQIQAWPACERSPADYTMGEPGTVTTMAPTEVQRIRGVPARFYSDNRLELSAGDVTIVIFGESKTLLLAAAQALRTAPGSQPKTTEDISLPAPVAGAQEGTMRC